MCLARGLENIVSGAESAGLSVLRDLVCLAGVGGLDLEGELDDTEDEDDDEEDDDEVSAFFFSSS